MVFRLGLTTFVPFGCLYIWEIFLVIMCLCWSELSMSWNIDNEKCYNFSIVNCEYDFFSFVGVRLFSLFVWSPISLAIESPVAMQKVVVHAKQFGLVQRTSLYSYDTYWSFYVSRSHYIVEFQFFSFPSVSNITKPDELHSRRESSTKKLEHLNYSRHSCKMHIFYSNWIFWCYNVKCNVVHLDAVGVQFVHWFGRTMGIVAQMKPTPTRTKTIWRCPHTHTKAKQMANVRYESTIVNDMKATDYAENCGNSKQTDWNLHDECNAHCISHKIWLDTPLWA